ncbi:siroheme synthase [Klebsiella pneumoniae subsp. rhinoscleromatis]|nr:siroheme synthase [Klebsiella pneumoniae subsp. rhinoscleromatis]
MGTMKAAEISAQLIAHGRDSDTPVAVISRGTRDDQQDDNRHIANNSNTWRKTPRCPPCWW